MAVREYTCKLVRVRKPFLSNPFLEDVGQPLGIRIDLGAMQSVVTALLYAMSQNKARTENIEQYKLQLLDESGIVFRTLYVTAQELEAHNSGYSVSASGHGGDAADGALAGVSNEQLIAELRRRLGSAY